ncbi:MAG: ligase-associated DNA damage response DEXH box helicase [Chitinophagaceae bacterium]|nr:ligase-associated DNA damage response DEXH box helicase [Chitinophagaceae bacterium]
MEIQSSKGFRLIEKWLSKKGLSAFPFQEETWAKILNGYSGLVNAPTGCGKTFSVFLGALIQFINEHPNELHKKNNGLQLLWITPLRALAKDLGRAMEAVLSETGIEWGVGIRNGDTSAEERKQQKKQVPEVLIITPESLHLLLAQKNYSETFKSLRIIAADEWHELLGSKRGVQVELAISRILGCRKKSENQKLLQIWGISATIGNLKQAKEVLLRPLHILSERPLATIVTAQIAKKINIQSLIPEEIETYPWAGHLGLKMINDVIDVIMKSKTTLLFINTRGMSERWYHALVEHCPELAGLIALHHGSIEPEIRNWVEENLHTGKLKVVVCTSSLDLGVDFRPVETVIQVGSPKGVARFLQRAGRSGHSPGETSKIYFVPTHSLELAEAAALKEANELKIIESKEPRINCYDVLLQYLTTLAVSDGFDANEIFDEIKCTNCYSEISREEFDQCLVFLTSGGPSLTEYEDFRKAEIIDGKFKITNRKIAMRHRMHIGTIVSEPMMKVKFIGGGYIGVIEEYFISRLNAGDSFTLAGHNLEFVMIKDMTALVRKSKSKKSIVPSWLGGRMPLSADLGHLLRKKISESQKGNPDNQEELNVLNPLFQLQSFLSHIPAENELLIEQIETDDGFHLFVFPFEGRLVHEALAALVAFRLSQIIPITFSFAMNDYGFELLSDQPIPLDDGNAYTVFSPKNLLQDIQHSMKSAEMARRKFRDIAVIGGLIFQGYPGEHKKARHLQSSAGLLFNVFAEYDPENLLLRQAYREVMEQQMEEARLRDLMNRIQKSKIIITFPQKLTPFSFPIKVDSMRENLTSEKLEDRVRKMQLELR